MRTALIVGALSCLACLAVGFAWWSELPAQVPIHWDLHGRADGFASRLVALSLGPVLGASLPLIVAVAMRLDPRRAALDEAHGAVTLVLVAIAAFAPALQLAVVQAAVRPDQALDLRLFQGALGALVACLGVALRTVGRNHTLGVRTPWSLRSDAVWARTHALAAWTLGAAGLVCVALPWLLPAPTSLGVSIGLVIAGALTPAVASWVWGRGLPAP